jgi:hypothetical protein
MIERSFGGIASSVDPSPEQVAKDKLAWCVERWGGNASHERRVLFAGPEGAARMKWRQLHLALRQGTVDLIDPDGRVVERS